MADTALIGQAQGVNKNLGRLVEVLQTAFPLHVNSGSFTMAAAASKTISDTTTKPGSFVILMPTSATAGTLMSGASSLYTSNRIQGASFTLSTSDSGNAAGTETFEYLLVSIG